LIQLLDQIVLSSLVSSPRWRLCQGCPGSLKMAAGIRGGRYLERGSSERYVPTVHTLTFFKVGCTSTYTSLELGSFYIVLLWLSRGFETTCPYLAPRRVVVLCLFGCVFWVLSDFSHKMNHVVLWLSLIQWHNSEFSNKKSACIRLVYIASTSTIGTN
jgi:hypothetical protein